MLLGAAFPAAASGRPIASVLLVDETKRAVVEAASAAQKSEFDRAVGRRLGVEANRNGSTDWRDLTFVHRTEEKDQRDVVFIFVNIALLSSVFMAAHFARSGALGPLTGLLAAIALLVWPIRARMPAMSFSAINYDEMLVPFFAWIMEVSALTTLLSIVAAVLASRLMKRGEGEASPAAVAGTSGLNISSVLVLLALGWWWRQDLLSPATLPGPDRMVEAFALTLSAASASITSLALLALFWAAEGGIARRAKARSNSRRSPTE